MGPIMKNMRQVSAEGGKELVSLIKEVRDTNKGVQQRLQTIETELTKTLGQAGRGFSEAEAGRKGHPLDPEFQRGQYRFAYCAFG